MWSFSSIQSLVQHDLHRNRLEILTTFAQEMPSVTKRVYVVAQVSIATRLTAELPGVLAHEVASPLLNSTSWAGQDAQNQSILLCPAQFFKFGPEILTRNLEQARRDITWRPQKQKGIPLTFRPFHDHGKLLAGRMSAVFSFS